MFKIKVKKSGLIARALQRAFSVGLSVALMLSLVPKSGMVSAEVPEPTVFTASAYANHWGRSDFRAYLNNATKTDSTLPIDTTIDGTNSGNFPAKFSDAEFALVQPFTYQTNVIYRAKEATAVYETTDRFWLPSTVYGGSQIISWGSEDINTNTQYSKSKTADKARIVPSSYRSCGASPNSWLRSSFYYHGSEVLITHRGGSVSNNRISFSWNCAAACKINLKSVIFASEASAKDIVGNSDSGAKKVEIAASENFGKITEAPLPDFGMYIKTRSDKTFIANSLTMSGNNLTVGYTGGEAGQYVMVQAFNEDSLTAGTTGYAAAARLTDTSGSINIPWQNSTDGLFPALDGYTVKVWMEDDTGSLAKATLPTTFVGTSKTETGAVKNGRVFAMKADLQCSWGDLAALDETAYNNVIVGKGQDGTDGASSNSIHGVNPTNQKIIFGGMEFWIAGRETAANGGAIDKDGDIMTLYQAKSVETRDFNASTSDYTVGGKPAVTLRLTQDPISEIYDGTQKVYPADKITTANLADGYTLNWLYRPNADSPWVNGMPTLGTYEVRCYTPGTDNYERTYSNVVNFKIRKELHSSDLKCSIPQSLVYDGTAKELTVTGPEGTGEITILYFDKDDNQLSGAPIDSGIYRAKANVTEGEIFAKAEGLPIIIIDTN